MKAIVFGTLASATIAANAINNNLGFPKPGNDVGDGRHVDPALSVTAEYFHPRRHPTLSQWALILHTIDATHPALVAYLQAHGLSIVDLDGTWLPPPVGVAG